jgi:ribosomal protein S13
MAKLSEKAQALLDAQVAYTLEQLTGKQLEQQIESLVDNVLADVNKLKLGDVVTPTMVKQTAHRYAIHHEIPPAIPELVGEVAREVYQLKSHDENKLFDLLTDEQFRDLMKKVVEMKDLREKIIREAVSNPIYGEMISEVLYHGITDYITKNPLTKKIPGAQSMMKLGKSVMDMASPNAEAGIKKYIGQNINASLRQSEKFLIRNLSDEKITLIATDVWNEVKLNKVSAFRDYVSETDIEDFFVIGFDYWRELRKTDYYRDMIDAGVDFFFKKYGKSTLNELLEEMGVDRDMIVAEAMHYAPHVLAVLNKKGLLEKAVRRQLEPFFHTDAAQKLLD